MTRNLLVYDYNINDTQTKILNNLLDSRGGVNKIVESIDNARDFNDFMASYFSKLQLDVAESPMPPQIQDPTALFGFDLPELMDRDGCAVPAVVGKCITFIEARGMNLQGLYREGGDLKAVRRLRDSFNRGNCLFFCCMLEAHINRHYCC